MICLPPPEVSGLYRGETGKDVTNDTDGCDAQS
jgi:hypothetical protein